MRVRGRGAVCAAVPGRLGPFGVSVLGRGGARGPMAARAAPEPVRRALPSAAGRRRGGAAWGSQWPVRASLPQPLAFSRARGSTGGRSQPSPDRPARGGTEVGETILGRRAGAWVQP